MSADFRPTTERLTIAGPAGDLEALLETPAGADGTRVAVICHPHPVYGGTMTNKVVHVLAKSFNERGMPAVRFNFRGVGASVGAYDEGTGETQDALAVIDWAMQRFPGAAHHDGESREQHLARVLAAVERIARAHPGARILVVSHGGSLRALRRHCVGEPVHRLENCGVYELRFRDEQLEAADPAAA